MGTGCQNKRMPKIIGESLASHRELTRTRLFDALGSLMAEQALESITMSQIAERAGVGRTAVYNHFADKEVLLLAYMRQVTEEFTRVLTARLEAEPDPLMRLRLYIRAHLQMISRYHVRRAWACVGRCRAGVPRTCMITRVWWARSSLGSSTRPWNGT